MHSSNFKIFFVFAFYMCFLLSIYFYFIYLFGLLNLTFFKWAYTCLKKKMMGAKKKQLNHKHKIGKTKHKSLS